jgi:hypothetical protein
MLDQQGNGLLDFSALRHDRLRQAIRGLVQILIRQCSIAAFNGGSAAISRGNFLESRRYRQFDIFLGKLNEPSRRVNALGLYRLLFEG